MPNTEIYTSFKKMKTTILTTIFLFLFTCQFSEVEHEKKLHEKEKTDWEKLILALIEVESGGDEKAIGKTNDAGVLQITPVYLADVNRILGNEIYYLNCRFDREKSIEMFEIYQKHYNPDKNIEKAIRLHNPRAGIAYKNKVMREFKNI